MFRLCVVAALLAVCLAPASGPARAGYIDGEEYM